MFRYKFHCSSVTKTVYRQVDNTEKSLYTVDFYAVTEGNLENKNFFEWMRSGSLKIGVYREDVFVLGKDYYIDISEAEE